MSDRLPPLTALRAFDAAARHMSFSRAAEELNVTPAALSFQIKNLEEHLGMPVFHRMNRAVELTEAGRALAPGVADGFVTLSAAWRAAQRTGDSTSLTVTAGPAFTAKWLAPRMFAFASAHPDIELRFTASLRLMDFDRDDVDVAIRFGLPREEKGLSSRVFTHEWVTPMMTPALAEAYPKPADLAHATLLHQDDTAFLRPPIDWPAWFRAERLPLRFGAGARFSQADHAIDAAVAGAGVVLGRVSLAERDLAEGRLVMPYDLALTTEAVYRVVYPTGAEARPQVRTFIAWLERQVRGLESYGEGRRFIAASDVPSG